MNTLLAIWLATIGMERVDLLDGTGSFVLTPFIVLSPLIVLFTFAHSVVNAKSFTFEKLHKMKLVSGLLMLFIITIGLSALLSNDIELSFKRYFLLLYEIGFCSIILSIIFCSKNYKKILFYGSLLGLIFYILFSILQLINWLALTQGLGVIQFRFVDLSIFSLYYYAPRLSGVVRDPNRCCFLLIFYWFMIVVLVDNYRYKNLITFITIGLLLLSISITGIMMFLSIVLILAFQNSTLSSIRHWAKRAFITAAIIVPIIIFSFNTIDDYFNIGGALELKFDTSEGASNATHLELIKRAFEVWSGSTKNLLIGNGFCASQNVLSDFYGDSKFANFHSLYASLLAESGIISLVIFLMIFFITILRNPKFKPLMIGVGVFNIFYLTTLDPIFWVCIFMSWFYCTDILLISGGVPIEENSTVLRNN